MVKFIFFNEAVQAVIYMLCGKAEKPTFFSQSSDNHLEGRATPTRQKCGAV